MQLCIDNKLEISPNYDKFSNELLKQYTERKDKSQRDNFYVHQCSFSKDKDTIYVLIQRLLEMG